MQKAIILIKQSTSGLLALEFNICLCQQPDGAVLRTQKQESFGGQHSQAGEGPTEVLRAKFGATSWAGRDVHHRVHTYLVGYSACHNLSTIEVKGMDGIRRSSVQVKRLVLQIFPYGHSVISGGTNQQIPLCCLQNIQIWVHMHITTYFRHCNDFFFFLEKLNQVEVDSFLSQ